MASKTSTLFVLACFLLIATQATCIHLDEVNKGPPNCSDHTPTPSPNPTPSPPSYTPPPVPVTVPPPPSTRTPPTYSSPPPVPVTPPPTQSPPTYTPSPVPVKAPPPPPTQPIIVSPPSSKYPPGPRTHCGYCVPRCQERCKMYRRMRPCVRVCAQCCEANNRCVPLGYETCAHWDTVVYHNETRTCP